MRFETWIVISGNLKKLVRKMSRLYGGSYISSFSEGDNNARNLRGMLNDEKLQSIIL